MTPQKYCPACQRMFSKNPKITRRQWEAQIGCSRACGQRLRGPWSHARTATLAALWAEGMPTSEIARKLRVPRNAVIGKANRLCLEHHKNAARFNPHLALA